MPSVASLIRAYARKYGIDPRAALAVAMGEGGLRWGAVGDQGTSYGPFQLHEGGALPAGRNAAWANSPAGLEYAIRSMSKAGARGLSGRAAIEAIVRQFERPADPEGSIANALARYGAAPTGGMGGAAAPSAPMPAQAGSAPNPRQALAMSLIQRVRGEEGAPDISQLVGLVRQTRQNGVAGSASGEAAPVPAGGGGFVSPLSTKMGKGSEFGIVDPEGAPGPGGKRYHAGKDWFAPAGAAVRAPVNGRIVEVKASRGNSGQVFGGVVKVQAPNGRVFVFRHVDPRGVKVGQSVGAGSLIATVSPWTGGSAHAHIEIWKSLAGGYRVENMQDPARFFA